MARVPRNRKNPAGPRPPRPPSQRERPAPSTTDRDSRTVLVDGSNVAHATEGAEARVENLLLVMEKLRNEGFQPLIVADAALRHQINDKAAYERLVEESVVHQAPAGTDADYFILSFARDLGARILTNDRFRSRAREFAAERDRIIRFMIVGDAVVLEHRNKRRSQ